MGLESNNYLTLVIIMVTGTAFTLYVSLSLFCEGLRLLGHDLFLV